MTFSPPREEKPAPGESLNRPDEGPPRRSGVRGKGALRIVYVLVAVYLGVFTMLYTFQTRVIFPGAELQGQRAAQVQPPRDCELLTLQTAAGERVVAMYGPALTADGKLDPHAADRPTMVFFYGNAMCLSNTMLWFESFRRMRLNVIIPDYIGYGMSAGRPSEQGCQATADSVYDYLVGTRKVDPKSIISCGWSLGGAVAIDLASRRQVAALIAFSTFTSGVDLGRRMLPFFPVSMLLRHRFDSLTKISKIRCPALIGHGEEDSLIPIAMGKKLAVSAGGPVSTVWIDGAEHNDFFDVGGKKITHAMTSFVDEHFH